MMYPGLQLRWFCLLVLATSLGTASLEAAGLRVPNATINVPATPPATAFQLVNAFNGVSVTAPTTIASAPGDPKRLFLCEKAGVIRLIPDVTAPTPTSPTFLNLASLLTGRNLPAYPNEQISTSSEQGLIGLAFHPDYAANGYFYLFYSVDRDSTVSSPIFERVSRFTRSAGNPNVADPASELILIEQADDYTNHQGGGLQFGPDGYLYISLGDEGDQNDAGNNSQRINKDFFAGLLRIDVDKKPGNLEPNPHPNPADYPTNPPADAVIRDAGSARYRIPVDNPFVPIAQGGSWNGNFNGVTVAPTYVRTEFWATGLRNPWRFSFDPVTGELWTGDVGGSAREEVNIITRGGNYGWALREGFTTGPKSGQAPANFDSLYGIRPLYDYRRTGTAGIDANLTGNSVTGGVVYRGSRFQSLQGAYLFADYVSGNIWTLRRNGTAPPTVTRIAGEGSITAFGTDPSNGDILLADYNNNLIRRLVTASTAGDPFPATLGATNLFTSLTGLTPAPGLLPYQVNLPFWSDYALKRRWFIIPDGTSKITWSRDGNWTFPAGQIWVKHFDMELTRGDPATKKRLETRLLVRNAGGAYGVSYRWNDAGTDATLVPDAGVTIPLTITTGGTSIAQSWEIPSRAQCLVCHTPQAGHALSANTRQFNMDSIIAGYPGNQLDLFRQEGFFTAEPPSSNILPRHLRPDEMDYPVEARVRSYLDVNCAYCHQTGSSTPTGWDGRAALSLAATGLINGPAVNHGGDPLNKLVVPGDAAHSIVLSRAAATNGFTRMPPLATNQTDSVNIALLTEWIASSLPAKQSYDQWRQGFFGSLTSPEGAPAFDADGDGQTNRHEFLTGSSPRDGAGGFNPQASLAGNSFRLTFTLPADRTATVETSADLGAWSLWDVPGNNGVPRLPGPQILEGPRPASRQYFRVLVKEN